MKKLSAMQSCDFSSSNPCIKILNLEQCEIVKHSILLLKGRLGNIKVDSEIQLTQLKPIYPQIEYIATPVSQRSVFKLLLNLNNIFECATQSNTNVEIQVKVSDTIESIININCEHKTSDNSYKIQPFYILCSDHGICEEEQQQQQAIIDLNLQLVQCVYADRLRESGLGRATFKLNGKCQSYEIKLTKAELWQLNAEQIWAHVASELLNSPKWQTHSSTNLKFIGFIACTKYEGSLVQEQTYANICAHLHGHVALGIGGLALFSVAYFYAWPSSFSEILTCFENRKSVDWKFLPDESNFRHTYGGVYASTLGAVCHEIGHIFDLGHTSAGIMGSGFDYLNRLFTIDTPTEDLPQRQVDGVQSTQVIKRLTQIKQNHNNRFLDKYREQRIYEQEEFYFTRNCALLLAYHNWLHDRVVKSEQQIITNNCIHFICVGNKFIFKCEFPVKCKLIEVRKNINGFVIWYLEFENEQLLNNFILPPNAGFKLNETHLIVLTCCGVIKRLTVPGAL